jgi:hemolysin III
VRSPKWLSATIGLGSDGWPQPLISQLLTLPLAAVLLVAAGGLFYTVGAIVYIRRRPDPMPSALGYHELFHVLTLAATGCLYASIAFFVLPRG